MTMVARRIHPVMRHQLRMAEVRQSLTDGRIGRLPALDVDERHRLTLLIERLGEQVLAIPDVALTHHQRRLVRVIGDELHRRAGPPPALPERS